MQQLINYIKEREVEFDIKQRLFLNGKLHSTQFNKWDKESIKGIIEQVEKIVQDKMVKYKNENDYYINGDKGEIINEVVYAILQQLSEVKKKL